MKKEINYLLKFSFVIAVALSLYSCASQRKVQTQVQQPKDRTVSILAVNDMHAALEKFPRLAFIADSLRNIDPDMLLVSAGDNQTGSPVNDQYDPKGLPIIELMNALDFDMTAVGNHEFDASAKGFSLLNQKSDFDYLCANIETPSYLDFDIKPYKIVNMPNGLKLGVVSLLELNNKGIPDCNPDYAAEFKFTDPFVVAKDYLNMKDSCDVVILLTHLGVERDFPLARMLPSDKIDLIIGGHSHTKIDKETFENDIMITQAKYKLKYAALINLTVKPDGKVERHMKLIEIGKGNEDAKFRKMVDDFTNSASALFEVIATAEDDFTNRDQIGFLMADALRTAAPTDFAIINKGGTRIDEMAKGDIDRMDVFTIDPFGNEVTEVNLTGSEIYDFYKAAYYADSYRIVYASGLNAEYTLKNEELIDVKLFTEDGKPLDLDKTYKVLTSSYMLSATKFEHKDAGHSLYETTADNAIEYLNNIKTVKSYKNDNRLKIIDLSDK